MTAEYAATVLAAHPQLTHVTVLPDRSYAVLYMVARSCPQLRKLTVWSVNCNDALHFTLPRALLKVSTACKLLHTLEIVIDHVMSAEDLSFLLQCPALRQLTLYCTPRSKDAQDTELAKVAHQVAPHLSLAVHELPLLAWGGHR
jgi:hypothetical protein